MEVPRHWRLRKQRYSLEGEVCLKCQTLVFPPRAVCPACGSEHADAIPLHGEAYPLHSIIKKVPVKA